MPLGIFSIQGPTSVVIIMVYPTEAVEGPVARAQVRTRTDWMQILPPPLTSFVIFSKLFNLSGLPFIHL